LLVPLVAILAGCGGTKTYSAEKSRACLLAKGKVVSGPPASDLVASAAGRVWLDDDLCPTALASWRTGTGRFHHVGDRPPPGAELVEPSVEDAYLLLRGRPDHDPVVTP